MYKTYVYTLVNGNI